MTTLTLSVPKTLAAIYLVAVGSPLRDPAALAREQVIRRVPEPLRRLALDALSTGRARVEVWWARDVAIPPIDLFAAMGATAADLAAVERALRFVVVSVLGPPGWPPAHEWSGRATATALAEALGGPVVDVFTPRLLSVDEAMASLPSGERTPPLARWVFVPYSPAEGGFRATTKGLGRFGLPEVQTPAVPSELVLPWCRAVTGVASRLLDAWHERLRTWGDAAPAFLELASELDVGGADVARAYGERPTAGGRGAGARVRFALDPTYPDVEVLLTVMPPAQFAGTPAQHLAQVCSATSGAVSGGWRA